MFAGARPVGFNYYYRGISDINYELEPSLFRDLPSDITAQQIKNIEQEIFDEFKLYAIKENWLKSKPDEVDETLYLMCIGRHCGLKCRLLDWSADCKCALLFLASENMDKDGCLWVLCTEPRYNSFRDNPLNVKCVSFVSENHWIYGSSNYEYIDKQSKTHYSPLGVLKRHEQHGFFTVSDRNVDLKTELNKNGFKLASIRVTKETKPVIRRRLSYMINTTFTNEEPKDDLKSLIDRLNAKVPTRNTK